MNSNESNKRINKTKKHEKNWKKAQSFQLLLWICFEFLMVLVVVLYLVAIVNVYVDFDLDIGDLQRELFIQNLMNSPEGICYKDEVSGKVYPGIINLDDFSNTMSMEAKLLNAFSYGERNPILAISMTLKDPNLPSYFFTDEEKLRPHVFENNIWVEKELISSYSKEQLTPFVYNGQNVETVYYQKQWYERWLVITVAGIKGEGTFTENKLNKFVLARDSDGGMHNAILEFSIITPGEN